MSLTRRAIIPAGAGLLASPAVIRSALAAPRHTLRMVYPDTPQHPFMAVGRRFAENVKNKTNGDVEVQVFTTGQLGTQVNMLTGMQTGIIDLCAHTSGFIDTLFPKFMVMDLPFLFPDSASAERVLDGPVGQQLLSEFPTKGIYGLSYGYFGWRVVSTIGRPMPTPDLMRGLKIRVQPGAIFAAMFRTLQATPIQVDISEVYLALSQRAIEAVETPMISLEATKHDEVVRTVNLTNHVYNACAMMASKRKLDSLDRRYQDAIRAAALEMTPDWRQTLATATQETQGRLAAKGLEISQVDRAAYRAALQPVYDEYRNIVGAPLMDAVLSQVA
ncbi:TRAP transporter substrate-binding protein [Roseococcus sp.]|uniref:TRAP transporter substrate-binding protein n=1 Tax=Roseococcus sp. TaxID=2109646 RepID=UPI003BA871A2